jgi:competence protein ComEA
MLRRRFLGILLATSFVQAKDPPAAPVNINAATAEQLETLPGVGPAIARAIVNFRVRSGPFRRVDELLIIKGMSKKKLAKLRPYVRLS